MYNMHLNHCVVVSLFVVQGRGLKRNCTRNILIEKTKPTLKQETSVFCEPEHPKKHATLR